MADLPSGARRTAPGACPSSTHVRRAVRRALLMGASAEQLELMAKNDGDLMDAQMDAYIGVRGGDNAFELSDVPGEQMDLYTRLRMNHRCIPRSGCPKLAGWCCVTPGPPWRRWPTAATEAFEDFFFKVCNLDYAKMSRAMDSLVARMERTDRVRLVGPGTDLSFSIKGIPAIKCDGRMNIPDGEVFTAPVRDSVNGTIAFNTPRIRTRASPSRTSSLPSRTAGS